MTAMTGGGVSIIVGQAIRSGHEDDFIRWQHKLTDAASNFPGYLGSELTPPTNCVSRAPGWRSKICRTPVASLGAGTLIIRVSFGVFLSALKPGCSAPTCALTTRLRSRC